MPVETTRGSVGLFQMRLSAGGAWLRLQVLRRVVHEATETRSASGESFEPVRVDCCSAPDWSLSRSSSGLVRGWGSSGTRQSAA